jgi:hypothetical protein
MGMPKNCDYQLLKVILIELNLLVFSPIFVPVVFITLETSHWIVKICLNFS